MRRDHRCRSLLLTALFLASAAAGCSSPVTTAALPLRSHFETDLGVGTERLRMVWDTGTQYTLIGAEAAARLRLPPAPADSAVQVVDASNVARDVQQFVHLQAPRLGATDVAAFAAPTLPLGPQFRFDGLLGMDLLLLAAWIVDAPAGRLLMVDASRLEAELDAAGYSVEARVPLRIDDGKPFVRVRLQDRLEVELLLDTGSRSTCLPEAVVKALELPPGADLLAERDRQRAEQLVEELRSAFDKVGANPADLKVTVETGGAVGLHGVEVDSRPFRLGRLTLGGRGFADLCVFCKATGSATLGEDVLAQRPWAVHWERRELLLLAGRR